MKRRVFVRTLVLGTGVIMVEKFNGFATGMGRDDILVKMIYNNIGTGANYMKKWGLAMWIEENGTAVLFDTGSDPKIFWQNLQTSGADLSKISVIIISHNHFDHTRGISVILDKVAQKATFYVPASDAPEIESTGQLITVKPVTGAQQITDSIWSTGEMKGTMGSDVIYEQSVIIVRDNLVYLYTGCAHPGIASIVERTKSLFPDKEIALAAGGFHLIDKTPDQIQEVSVRLKELKVQKIAPSHCTGDKAIEYLRSEWKDRFIDFNIGDDLKI